MVDAMFERLDVTVEHRGVGLHPDAVRDPVDLEVFLGAGLVVRDARTHFGVENLRSAAGKAVEPRCPQTLEDLDVRHPVVGGEEVDLDRGEALHVNVGFDALEAREKFLVITERQPRMETVDDVDLGGWIGKPRFKLAPRFFELHRVRARRTFLELGKRTEETRRDADVGHLNTHVAVEVRPVTVQALANLVRELTEGHDGRVMEEDEPIIERQSLAGTELAADGVEAHGISSTGRMASSIGLAPS